MDLPLLQYPLDPTGKNPDNLVHGEIHNLPNKRIRAIAPTYGAFFTEDLKVVDNITQVELIRGTQYVAVDLVQTASEVYGKEICSVILIIDPNVNSSVLITYQALGGMYTKNFEGVVSYLNKLAMDQRPAAWPDILNRPKEFVPTQHLHDIGDVYGFEYITYALERIRNAILMTNDPVIDEILSYVDNSVVLNDQEINRISTDNANHIANRSNPHNTTKVQVGLSYVENMRTATEQEAQSVANTADDSLSANVFPENKYLSIRGLNSFKNKFMERIMNLETAHTENKENPHEVTKLQIGLGDVENHPVVTDEQIVQNIPNDNYITFNRLRTFADNYLIASNRRIIDLTGLSSDHFFPVWWQDNNTLDRTGTPNRVNIGRNYDMDYELNPLNRFHTTGWSGSSEQLFEIVNLSQVYDETIRIPRFRMKCYYRYLNASGQNFPRWEQYNDYAIFGAHSFSGCYLRGGFKYYFTTSNTGTLESMKYSRSYTEIQLAYYVWGPGFLTNPWETYPRDNRELGMFTKAFHKSDSFLERPIDVFQPFDTARARRPASFEVSKGLHIYDGKVLNMNGVKNPFP